jgi:hypothetical protein
MSADNMTLEQKVNECKRVIGSFIYFLDTYVWIEDKENKAALKLKLWPDQRRVVPLIVEAMLLIILKARQLGLTWITAAYVLWQTIRNPLFLVIIISTTEDLSIEFLDRVYFILDRLPPWMKPPVKSRTKQVLEFQHQGGLVSTIKSLPTTAMGAQSKTPNLLVMDETCTNRMAKTIYNASLPGIEAAKGQVIIISNSIKEGSGWYWTRDLYIAAMRGLNKFKRVFLPWTAHPGRPEDFKDSMVMSGMTEREVNENYPDTEDDAITDRNIKGVYYAKQMSDARKEGRLCSVPWSPGHEVYTFWDLGIDDSMTIWFMQQIGREYRFIDYYENVGMGLVHYAKILKEKPYVYGDFYMPHDASKRELGGDTDVALSRKETAENLGLEPVMVVKKARDSQAVMNGIEAVRNILPQCWFDERKCAKGIVGLESYRSEYDEEKDKLDNKPLHNFASHAADSFRTFAQGYQAKVAAMPFERRYRDYTMGSSGSGWMGS